MKPTSYWKLGLFVVLGMALAVVALVYFSSGLWGRSAVDYEVYFDESVQGLDVGSLVRFRGVTLGQVSGIAVAPDGRHIQVTCSLRTNDLRKQGLATGGRGRPALLQAPGLRAQLALIGLTGQEIVLLDFFDPSRHPVPELPFASPERTIPATPSTLKVVEDSLEASTEGLPGLVDSLRSAVDGLQSAIGPWREADLPQHATATLRRADDALASVQRLAAQLSSERAPEQAAHAVAELNAALASLRALLEGLGSRDGLVSSTQRATDAVTETVHGATALGRELDETLRDAQGALRELRRLGEAVDRDPDMLLKGRARGARE